MGDEEEMMSAEMPEIHWKGAPADRMRINAQDGVVWLTWPFLDGLDDFLHGLLLLFRW